MIDDKHILDYVHQNFGKAACLNLKNIHQGGLNNSKGRDYENYFQLFKAFEIAAQDDIDLDKQILANQVLGFVDDICHIDNDQLIKYNYQAKNSSGSAADWTPEISDRFAKQWLIDTDCYQMAKSINCLLVSDKVKALQNLSKIPLHLVDKDTCQHFAYHPTLYELVYQTPLSQFIQKLINNNNRSNIDYAAKLILGVLQSNHYQSVADIFTQAQAEGHPNPFVKFRVSEGTLLLPDWLQQLLTNASPSIRYGLDYDILTIILPSGFATSINIELLNQLDHERTAQVRTINDLLPLVMQLTAQSLTQHLSSHQRSAIK